MPSNDGSRELPDEFTADMVRKAMAQSREQHYRNRDIPQPVTPERLAEWQAEGRARNLTHSVNRVLLGVDVTTHLTTEEQDRIADGEPYCFRCGKPASSFPEYAHSAPGECLASAVDYVRHEEGTYNPDTNRFACDTCYIAIGTPSAPGGWKAP